MKVLALLLAISTSFTLVYGAPAPQGLEDRLRALQDQLNAVEKQYVPEQALVPQKRMVAWQPMKRGLDDGKAPLLHAVEARLAEVLRAGERLGIAPEEVLQDLRARSQFN